MSMMMSMSLQPAAAGAVQDSQPIQTKDELIHVIKEWVKCDNEIRELQKQLTIRKNEKRQTSLELMEAMKAHDIDCFNIKDGNIQYKKQNIKKPLTQKHLLRLLVEYHDGDEARAADMQEFLQTNREQVVKEKIVRKGIPQCENKE
jgi:hypothetical protein